MSVIHHSCLKDIYMSYKHYVTYICCDILNNIQIHFRIVFGHLLLRMHYWMTPPGLDPEEGSQRFIPFLVGLLVFRFRAVTFKSEGCVFLVQNVWMCEWCAGVNVRQVLWTSAYTFASTLATGCAYALMYVQFVHWVLGNEDGGFQLVYESTCCLAWGVSFDKMKDRGVGCVFSIFNAGGSVCMCMCVYTHTHTHTAQMGYSDVSPGVGMTHLEGPKNPNGLNLGTHIFWYVYKVHMCMYMLGGGMRSWNNCFFLQHIFPSEKKKQKMWTQTTDNLKSEI